MMLLSKTFEHVTEESAANGEAEEVGYVFQDEPYTFRELIDELRNYSHASSYPCRGLPYDWVTTESYQDFQTGDYRSYSLHFSSKNSPKLEKYWAKALKMAGLAQ